MLEPEDFIQLKKEIDQLQKKADRAQGALEQVKIQLKSEFGIDSLEEAEELLKNMESEHKKLTDQYEKMLQKFKDKWLSRIE